MSPPDLEHEFKKDEWWKRNIEWLEERDQSSLWDRPHGTKGRKLKCAYREMLGVSGHEMYERIRKFLPEPSYFEGVDRDPEILLLHALNKRPFPLFCADFWGSALTRVRRIDPVLGILNADTQDAITRKWWTDNRKTLREIVDHGARVCPGFALILNFPLGIGQGYKVTVDDQIQIYADGLEATFKGWSLPHLRDDIVPLKGHEMPFDMGIFHLYRSERHVTRMVTVRASFNPRNKSVTFDRSRL